MKLREFYLILKFGAAAILALLAGIFINSYGDFDFDPEAFKNYYKTYSDINDDERKRGWIPQCIPEDAYDIREQHNLSPEYQIIRFQFKDLLKFKNTVERYSKISASEANWHPKGVRSNDLSFYQLPDFDNSTCLIVHWEQKKAYFRSDCIIKQGAAGDPNLGISVHK